MYDRHTVKKDKVKIKTKIPHARVNHSVGSVSDDMIWLKIDINPNF